jgi:hypothetical protein
MAITPLTDAVIIVDGEDVSGVSNEVTIQHNVAPLNGTTFGRLTKVNVAGVMDDQFGAKGFYDPATLQVDGKVFQAAPALMGPGSSLANLTVLTSNTLGAVGYGMQAVLNRYTTLGQHGELIPYELDGVPGASGLIRGFNLLQGQKVATGQDTPNTTLGAVTSGQRVFAQFQCTQIVGGNVTMRLLSAVTNWGTPTTRITFTLRTTKGGEWIELAGPVTDTFWRADWTQTATSFTGYLLVAILTPR